MLPDHCLSKKKTTTVVIKVRDQAQCVVYKQRTLRWTLQQN
jgi:hypothetical protein